MSCVSQAAGPTMHKKLNVRAPHMRALKADGEEYDITDTCLSTAFMEKITAKGNFAQFQPTEFQCLNDTFLFEGKKTCSMDPKFRYFLIERYLTFFLFLK